MSLGHGADWGSGLQRRLCPGIVYLMRRLVAGDFNGHSAVCWATPWSEPGVHTFGDVIGSTVRLFSSLLFCVRDRLIKCSLSKKKKRPSLFTSFDLKPEPIRLGIVYEVPCL